MSGSGDREPRPFTEESRYFRLRLIFSLPIFSLGVDQRTVKTFRRVEHDGSRLFPPFPPVGRADVDLERLPNGSLQPFS